MIYIHRFSRHMMKVNLFKSSDQRSENSIRQQKIITRVYLFLLTSMYDFLLYISDIIKHILSCLLVLTIEPIVHPFKDITVSEIISFINQHSVNIGISYFVLLGSFVTIILFTSFSTEMKTMTTSDPTLNTYKNLQVQYSILLKCPCSNIIIPHKTFISLSPRFHQVCSSDFVTP